MQRSGATGTILRLTVLALICAAAAACDDGGDEALADAAADLGADVAPEPEPEDPVAALTAAVDVARYGADLEFIARAPRVTPEPGHWQAAQDRCAEVFLNAGLEVTRQPFPDGAGGVNVIGRLPGLERPAEQLLLGAHYDSEFDCNGADDNASGTAAVLEAARVLATRRYARTLVFVCFDGEENDLSGSIDYARRAQARGDDIRGAFVLEMIGYRDRQPGSQFVPQDLALAFPALAEAVEARMGAGDFILYAADDDREMLGHLQAAASDAGLPLLGLQLDAVLRSSPLSAAFRRSDHAPLWDAGYPAMMLTDTAEYRNPRYHCALGDDDIDGVDVDFAATVTTAVVGALAAAATPVDGAPAEGRVLDPAPEASPTPLACDPVAQDCADGDRCALIMDAARRVACVSPTAEPLGLDAPCARAADGSDRCDVGLFCTLTGRAVGDERRCRPLCLTDDDCPPDEACPRLGAEASNCVPRCDAFDSACPPGTVCDPSVDNSGLHYRLICGQAGGAGEGQSCARDFCMPGLVCASEMSLPEDVGCVRWCRPSAPDCPAGRRCHHIPRRGLPDDLGVCLPEDRVVD